ncbi:MAG: hypothetical protein IT385_18930 [Deltaproteobacteria bacterium]|nr:hypothetical protein [Deltaproteobacteria bacterium]
MSNDWQPWQDAKMREYYGRRSVGWLMRELGDKTKAQVYARAEVIGLARSRDRREWTPEDDRLLLAHVGDMDETALARLLDRRVGAIVKRLYHHRVMAHDRRVGLSVAQVAELLDRAASVVRAWIVGGKLRAQGSDKRGYTVRTKDLRKFLLREPWAINVRQRGEVPGELVKLLGGEW